MSDVYNRYKSLPIKESEIFEPGASPRDFSRIAKLEAVVEAARRMRDAIHYDARVLAQAAETFDAAVRELEK